MEVAFHAALIRLGAETVAGSLAIWEDLPATSKPANAVTWLGRATAFVMGQRRKSRELAFRYYRLVRALRTGYTIRDPARPGQKSTTLDELRGDWARVSRTAPTVSSPSPALPGPTSPTPQPVQVPQAGADAGTPESDELDRILIEELAEIEAEAERIEREAEKEARDALAALGASNQQKKLDAINTELKAEEVDRLREQAHKDAGNRQAASGSRLAMNGARSTLWSMAEKDKRTVGYVRLSRTGTPCGWCAMLISRGPVYRSEASASFKGGAASYDDGDKYHDNCNCYAMPIFSYTQYDSSELFALNREYDRLWPTVTRGLSGKAAVSAWRRFIRSNTPKPAQEAGSTTTSRRREK